MLNSCGAVTRNHFTLSQMPIWLPIFRDAPERWDTSLKAADVNLTAAPEEKGPGISKATGVHPLGTMGIC